MIQIRYPLNKPLFFGSIVLCLVNISFAISKAGNDSLYITLAVVFALIIAVVVTRRLLKPKELRLEASALSINDLRLETEDILSIYVDRDFTIGIRSRKNIIVPLSWCFELSPNKYGIGQLLDWAAKNKVNVEKRKFTRWM